METKETNMVISGKEKSLNRVELIGRVGQEPRVLEKTYPPTAAGFPGLKTKTVVLSLATTEIIKVMRVEEGQSEERHRIDWHRILILTPGLQELVIKNVQKGDRVLVTGRLHYDLIKKETKFVTSIACDDLIFLSQSKANQERAAAREIDLKSKIEAKN
jgi:single-stranded DNA-binding protein